jgi:hypothetical protein
MQINSREIEGVEGSAGSQRGRQKQEEIKRKSPRDGVSTFDRSCIKISLSKFRLDNFRVDKSSRQKRANRNSQASSHNIHTHEQSLFVSQKLIQIFQVYHEYIHFWFLRVGEIH